MGWPVQLAMSDDFDGIIASIGTEHYRTEIVGGRHRLLADEPEALGGTDAGPGPYVLLLSALGACKAITCRMYADRKGWALREAVFTLRHDRRHADDCENCDAPNARLDHFDVEAQFIGDLTHEQRERLLEISERCPVHKTISGDVRIDSTLVEPD